MADSRLSSAVLPPQTPPDSTSVLSPSALNALSAGTLVLTPVLALLPPRRLNLSTLALAATFGIAADYQLQVRTGQGAVDWLARRQHLKATSFNNKTIPSATKPHGTSSPARSLQLGQPEQTSSKTIFSPASRQSSLHLRTVLPIDPWVERGAALGADGQRYKAHANLVSTSNPEQSSQGAQFERDQSFFSTDNIDWKTYRASEEREAEARGEGISDIIMDQIWQVVNQEHHGHPQNNATKS